MVGKVEEVLNREGLYSIGDIVLKMLCGNIENLSIQGQTEMLSALRQYIKCTIRFRQIKSIVTMHAHSVSSVKVL